MALTITPAEARLLSYTQASDLSTAVHRINLHLAKFMDQNRTEPITWQIPDQWRDETFINILVRHFRAYAWEPWSEGEKHGGRYYPSVIKFGF